jgi:hypothetical protein
MITTAVNAAMVRSNPRLDQERLELVVSHNKVIGNHGIKSRLVAERQLLIGDNGIS